MVIALGEESAASHATDASSALSFRELISLLEARHESILAENKALRNENRSLRALQPGAHSSKLGEAARPSREGSSSVELRPLPPSDRRDSGRHRAHRGDAGLEDSEDVQSDDLRGPTKDSFRMRSKEKGDAQRQRRDSIVGDVLGVDSEALSPNAQQGSGVRFEGGGLDSQTLPPNDEGRGSNNVTSLKRIPETSEVWTEKEGAGSFLVLATPRPSGIELTLSSDFNGTFYLDSHITRCYERFILTPESRYRMFWDIMGMLFLIFDVMHTPLMVFFEPVSRFERGMAVFTTVFWTMDIGVSFLRGYYRSCVLEMRPRQIALRYIRHEFLPDLIICALDWSMMVVETEASSAVGYTRLTKAFRFVRIARILRLVRLVKIPALVELIENNTTDFSTLSLIHVSKCIVMIIGTNHFIACGWYYVAQIESPSWKDVLDQESRTVAYRYVTSLHWSITQFTPASMEVQPQNFYERLFAICTIFIGLIMFSSFVSTITSTMTTFRVERQKRSKQKDYVRRYLTENHISLALGSRISSFLGNYKFGARRRVARNDITLLKALPKNIRLMIDWEAYQHILIQQTFLFQCNEFSPSGLLQICHQAVEEVSISSCEELFHCGQRANAMYITLAGSMQYFAGFDEGRPQEIVGRRRVIVCEHALWLKWNHQGRIFSLTPCDFISMSAKNMKKALCNHPHLIEACRKYAHLYHIRMESVHTHLSTLDDFETDSAVNIIPGENDKSNEQTVTDLYHLNFGTGVNMAREAFTQAFVEREPSDEASEDGGGVSASPSTRTSRSYTRTNTVKSAKSKSSFFAGLTRSFSKLAVKKSASENSTSI